MPDSQTFLPNGKPLNIIYFWLVPSVLATLALIKEGISIINFIVVIFVFGILSLDILLYEKPISITISTIDKILQYRYRNCWNQNRLVTVDLNTATANFKHRLLNLNYRLFGKIKFGRRILLYNHNYFSNKVVIKQDDELGYSEIQLDQMFNLIKQRKEGIS
jgi:hypothetical protein